MKHRVMWFACLLLLLGIVACGQDNPMTPPAEQAGGVEKANGNPNPMIIPPNARPHGASYGEWAASFVQWFASVPLDQNPALDETGEFMGNGQSGSVWYLCPNYTGGVTHRTGVIPAGKTLCIGLIAWETSTREGNGETEAELRAAAAGVIDLVTNLSCEIDGIPVQNLGSYRFQAPELFSLTVPDNNVFDLWGVPTSAGTYYPSMVDGYFIMVNPLPAGTHTIHWYGEIAAFGYYPDITYDITVVGGSHGPHVGS